MIKLKKKICIQCEKETYLFSKGRCKSCAQKAYSALKKKVKKESVSNLTKVLDEVFSSYIRTRFAKDGLVKCFTCPTITEWKKGDCGHFQSRKHKATRWDEKNCQFQCKGCNIFNQGQQFIFGQNLDAKYGEGTAEMLMIKAKNKTSLKAFELQLLISEYTGKLNQLKCI